MVKFELHKLKLENENLQKRISDLEKTNYELTQQNFKLTQNTEKSKENTIYLKKKIDDKDYKVNILIVCFNTSELLKDKKFVSDFLKLSSYISIKKIIENKK